MSTGMIAGIFVLVVLFIMAVVMLVKAATVIRQANKGIVERFGRYKETLDPGLRFVWPFLDRMVSRVDMREQVLDVAPQSVITKDNVGVTVDAVVYWYVTDAKAVTYEVANFSVAVTRLAQTNLRNLVGDMILDDTLTSRERINAALRTTIDEATDKWGVKVTRVEVREIKPPDDITDAMSKQMKAEREKRATILTAEATRDRQIIEGEGIKQNAILVAEGERQKAVLTAEGDKLAAMLRAEGQARAVETISMAADQFFVGNAQLLKQLEVTQACLEKNTKVVIPDKSTLVNVLGIGDVTAVGNKGG